MSEEKCCCSKEPLGTIPIMRIISKLDACFAKNDMDEAGRILDYWEKEARALNDNRGLCEILSEQIGYFRKVGNKERGLAAVDSALALLSCMDNGDSVSNATIYLNCATTMKAFGKAQEAIKYYQIAKDVFERVLPNDDFRLAGLYNNYATALVDLKKFSQAREFYDKAIDVLTRKKVFGELAVTYVNLAHLVCDEAELKGVACDDEIEKLLDKAWECLDNKDQERDGNYAFICSKCAPAFGYFGYFMQKDELQKRADEIYSRNC